MAGRSLKKKKKSDLKPYPPMASNFDSTQIYSVEVVKEFHHDPYAFTQGLVYGGNETLFESTGLYQRPDFAVDFTVLQFFYAVDFGLCVADFSQFCSLIPKYLTFDLFLSLPLLILIISVISSESGSSYWEGSQCSVCWCLLEISIPTNFASTLFNPYCVEALQKMDDSYFGEGLTLLGERLFQVTWLKKTGFIYDRNDLSKVNGTGPSVVIGEHVVKYKGHEVHNLNELEFVDGEIWANVWQTDCIARISHEDGTVRGWILLNNLREGLLAAGRRVMTGKLWPKLYEIKVHPMKRRFQDGVIEQLCLRMPFFT
ncbi:Glutaminyl-peptide cyclotransferase [Vitis vinifera]|uniref:Glutaminyl-peptide cyclotransferase n=1 Tax=Vitis vinifera TaxID=29760 RepID=A0A438IZ21_VITVI|nr:Glutaminyl-peptide cyclotransferase [Vitis vinifera]